MDRGFVTTDERCRTNVDGVYAVGDIVPGLQLAHRGFQQGIFVAEDIAGLDPQRRSTRPASPGSPTPTPRSPRSASTRTAPASSTAPTVETLTYDLGGNGKSQILKTQGFVKLVRRKDGPVVGVHLVGDRVGELIGEAQLIYSWEGLRRGRRAPGPRPPDPERSPRRGPPGPGRQATARPLLTRTAPEQAKEPMATEVTLPALGESVTEGTVTRWLKQVGDEVAVDEPLLEVSTDKVDTEIPSPVAGTLLEIKANEDETVEVGAVLA